MQLSPDDIQQLEKLSAKNPVIQKVLDEYKKLTESPYLDGYLTLYRQLSSWNKEVETKSGQINIVQVQMTDDEGNIIGTVDKTFDNALKLLKESPGLYDKLDWFRTKLLPQEASDLKQYTSTIDKARQEIKTENDIQSDR
jgi:hypothetical protein